MKKMMKNIFLELILNILKNYITFHSNLPFLSARIKIEKVEKLAPNWHDKIE